LYDMQIAFSGVDKGNKREHQKSLCNVQHNVGWSARD